MRVNFAPSFTSQQAEQIAKTSFGIKASATPLPSERDQNFRLIAADGRSYVLKIANPHENHTALAFQNQIMIHLSAHGITCPMVCNTADGAAITSVQNITGTLFAVRLLTYVEGKPLGNYKPHLPETLYDIGRFIGNMDVALQQFRGDRIVNEDFHWDLANAQAVIQANLHVHDDESQALLQHFLDIYQQYTAPHLAQLPVGLIHNDANNHNIILNNNGAIAGIIDFGDMVESHLIGELAIACAYVMLNKVEPLVAAVHVIRAYNQSHPINELELATLFSWICMRLCLSVTMVVIQHSQQPDNTYLSITEQDAWSLLKQLKTVHPRFAESVFRDACNLQPVTQHDAVRNWLIENAFEFGKAMDGDSYVVFDLSVGSRQFPDLAIQWNIQQFIQEVESLRSSKLAVGRYREPRLIYQSDLFSHPTDTGEVYRTIHIGIDLFANAGSNVYAPLAGTIHSFCDNDHDLDYGPTIILEHSVSSTIRFYTLYGHLSRESLHNLEVGQLVNKGNVVGKLGNADVNGSWPSHLHFQIVLDMLDRIGEFPGVVAPHEQNVWCSFCPDPNLILQIPVTSFPSSSLDQNEILGKRARHIGKSLSISYRKHLHIVRGYRQHLYDADGQAYLDCVNNVAHVGHSHPHVVEAAQKQTAVLNTNTRYLHANLVEYAERLVATFPPELSVCFFVCSGSEANDLALRMARAHTGGTDTIVLDGAYHGNLSALIDISPYKFNTSSTGKPNQVQICPIPDTYRGEHRGTDAGIQYGNHIAVALDTITLNRRRPAAFIAESLLGCGGQIVLPNGFLMEAYSHVRTAGGVCIADEVQVGFGRVGSHFWGFETQAITPDIVTMGKPIGNGHPLAAVITTPEIAASFANGMEYFNTFGGNPVSCAVGMAVLDVIESEDLQANALDVGTYLMQALIELKHDHHIIGDVRGLGLFIGLELVLNQESLEPAAAEANYIIERLRDHYILVSTDGPLHNVLKIKPPIIFSRADADRLTQCLAKILVEDPVRQRLY